MPLPVAPTPRTSDYRFSQTTNGLPYSTNVGNKDRI